MTTLRNTLRLINKIFGITYLAMIFVVSPFWLSFYPESFLRFFNIVFFDNWVFYIAVILFIYYGFKMATKINNTLIESGYFGIGSNNNIWW